MGPVWWGAQVWQQWEVAGVLSHGSGVCGFSQDPQGFAALRFIEGADTIVPVADSAAMSQGAVPRHQPSPS